MSHHLSSTHNFTTLNNPFKKLLTNNTFTHNSIKTYPKPSLIHLQTKQINNLNNL